MMPAGLHRLPYALIFEDLIFDGRDFFGNALGFGCGCVLLTFDCMANDFGLMAHAFSSAAIVFGLAVIGFGVVGLHFGAQASNFMPAITEATGCFGFVANYYADVGLASEKWRLVSAW